MSGMWQELNSHFPLSRPSQGFLRTVKHDAFFPEAPRPLQVLTIWQIAVARFNSLAIYDSGHQCHTEHSDRHHYPL